MTPFSYLFDEFFFSKVVPAHGKKKKKNPNSTKEYIVEANLSHPQPLDHLLTGYLYVCFLAFLSRENLCI